MIPNQKNRRARRGYGFRCRHGPSLVKKFTSTAAAVTFDDRIPPKPARFIIDNFDVSLANLSTSGNTPADIDLACRINDDAALGIQGHLRDLRLRSANLDIDLNGLDIRIAQNYFPDSLLVTLNSGTLGFKGGIDFKRPAIRRHQLRGRATFA